MANLRHMTVNVGGLIMGEVNLQKSPGVSSLPSKAIGYIQGMGMFEQTNALI